MYFVINFIKRVKIFIIILSILLLSLFLLDNYLKNYKHNSLTIENFKDMWLSNLKETQPGVAYNLSNFITNKDWKMLDYCLRNATTSPSCYSNEIEVYNKKLLSFEELDLFIFNEKNNNNFFEESNSINSESEKWLRENTIFGYRKLASGKTQNEFFSTPDLIKSPTLTNEREKVKILVISDSFGIGDGLYNKKETWPRELERQLNLIDNRYEVSVLAAGGANYKEFYNYINLDIVDNLDPDLIILSLVSNDFNQYSNDLNLSFDSNLNKSGLNYDILAYISCINSENNLVRYISFFDFFENIKNFLLLNYCDNLVYKSNIYAKNPYMDDRTGENWANLSEIEEYYKKIIESTSKPIFFYNLLSYSENNPIIAKLKNINIKIINDLPMSSSLFAELYDLCNRYKQRDCFRANPYDYHHNLVFSRYYISKNIINIYDKIKHIKGSYSKKEVPDYILEALPYQIRYKKFDDYIDIISYDAKSKLIDSFPNSRKYYQSLCATEGRNHIRINLNEYIIKDKNVKVSLIYSENDLLIKSSGYNTDGFKINSNYENFILNNTYSFIGSEEKNSIVLASKDEGCYGDIWGFGLVKLRISVT
jgi:hypothetical protein